MRVIDSMLVHRPPGMRLYFLPSDAQQLESPEKNLPNVAFFGRQLPVPGKPLSPFPRKHQLYSPALVNVRVVVQCPFHMSRALYSRKLPPEIGPTQAAWLRSFPKSRRLSIIVSSKYQRVVPDRIKFRHVKLPAFLERVAPNVKHLISGPARVGLEFVVSVPAINKNLHVVLIEDERVFLRDLRLHKRLFHPKCDV